MYRFKRTALVFAAASVPTFAAAQSSTGSLPSADDKQWMLALSALRDEDAYEHLLASLNLSLNEDTWFALHAGQSQAPSTEKDVSAGLLGIGVEHNLGRVGFGFDLEQWGDRNNLESTDWQAEIFLRGDRYRVGWTYESRAIDIYFSGAGAPIATDLRKVGIDADGIAIDWRYRLMPNWQVYGAFADYDYPRALRIVPRADRLDLLSTSAVTLAYGFVDSYRSVGIERAIGLKLVNLDLSQDRSTIGGERLRSAAASILWPASPRLDLEFRLGASRAAGFGSSVYGGVSILIYGGG